MNYITKQMSWPTTLIVAIMMVTVYFSLDLARGDNPIDLNLLISIEALLGLGFSLFYHFTVEVNEREINLKFGIGLIRRTINIGSIESVKTVRNKWWYGWGIRLTPHGWLWNIYGLDAVEIKYKGIERGFRIGTNDSSRLKAEIDKRISRIGNKKW